MSQARRSTETARLRFARLLRSERLARGISQEALAELAGLHRTYVGSVERGERNIAVDNMEINPYDRVVVFAMPASVGKVGYFFN